MSNHSVVNPGGVRVDRGAARKARRGWSLWLLIAVWIGASSAMAAEVVQVRVGKHADFTRVVFELDRAAGYRIERKDTGSGPGELVVSLQASSPSRKIRSKKSLISEVKVDPVGTKSTARIQLRQANLPLKEMILTNPPRIVLDIMSDSRTATKVATAAKSAASKTKTAAQAAGKTAKNTAAATASKASAALAEAGNAADAGTQSVIEQAKAARAAAAARIEKTKAAAAEKTASAKTSVNTSVKTSAAKAAEAAEASAKAADAAAQKVADAAQKAADKTTNAAKEAAGAAKTAATNAADSAAATAASAKTALVEGVGQAGDAATAEAKAKARAAQTAAANATHNAAKNAATPPDSKSPMVVQTRKAAQKKNDGGWMNWALMGAGALLLVGGGAFVASRRRGETVDFFDEEDEEDDGEPVDDVNPFAGLEESDDAPAMRDASQDEADAAADAGLGESAGFALGADASLVEPDAGDLAGQDDDEKEQESVFETDSAENDMDVISRDAVNESLGMPPTMGGVPDELMQLVRDMQAKVEGLEGRVEELVDARDRLERQVAAQTEELRVQRAAIARTQRAVRNLARPEDDEQEPTEPALRDPNKND